MLRVLLFLVVLALLGAASAQSSSSSIPVVDSSSPAAASASPSSSSAAAGVSSSALPSSAGSSATPASSISTGAGSSSSPAVVGSSSSAVDSGASAVGSSSTAAPASAGSSSAAGSSGSALPSSSAAASSGGSSVVGSSSAAAGSSAGSSSTGVASSGSSAIPATAVSSGSSAAASSMSAAPSSAASSSAASPSAAGSSSGSSGGGGGIIPGGSSGAGSSSGSSSGLTSCINAGYDLTAITGADLLWTGASTADGSGSIYDWAIRPCGTVTTPGYCTDMPGEFCQGGTTVSTLNLTGANVPTSSSYWGQIELNGQYGVAQFLQDGTDCGYPVGDREGTIVYLCNATATTPFLSYVREPQTCHYLGVVQTSAVCSQVPPLGFSTDVGTTIVSPQCGGGIYDLTPLNDTDILGYVDGNFWAIRPCGPVAVQNCSNNGVNSPSVCQYGDGYGWPAGAYEPDALPMFYQYLAPGSVSQFIQDGLQCGDQMRFTNVTYVCNATATTPVIVRPPGRDDVEGPGCHYYLQVETDVVCGTAFASLQPPAGGSSSAAAAPSSSAPAASSSSAAVPVESSSTGSPAGAPSSPSTAAASSVTTVPTPTVAPSTASQSSVITSIPSPTASVSSSTGVPLPPTSVPVVVASTGQQAPPQPGNGAVGGPASAVGVAVAVVAALSLLFA